MPSKYDTLQEQEQETPKVSQDLSLKLETFLTPLLLVLDTLLDKRLVRTLVQCCVAILRFRNSKQGLLLSELGSYMQGYHGLSENAAAGTKRVGNLIRSLKWNISPINDYLLSEANTMVEKLRTAGKQVLCIWDGSVIEKPESSTSEGLCPVISSKAKRLNRSRKGLVFNMPTVRPIMVTGMHWTGAILAGMEGSIKVAMMSWWTTRGDYATKMRAKEEEMLRTCVRKWGNGLLHIFDRGYASGPWLQVLQPVGVRFVIRWIKKHLFIDAQGKEKHLWQIGQGKKYLAHKMVYDLHTSEKMPCDIWWAPVRHESYAYQLYLVKVRVKRHVSYLITNERVKTEEDAWTIVFAYRRRWQIETCFRYGKSELAMESPRVWSMEHRLKLLAIVTLVYAFLLHLMEPSLQKLVQSVLCLKCHRTGKRCRDTLVPLYRLRWAISRLWDDCHPLLGSVLPPTFETLRAFSALNRSEGS